ncbi:MAG: ABC-three component system protein [Thermoleophilia bacterium]
MNAGDRGQYSAAASALGYFYQCRYALLDALRRLPDGDPLCISLETLDDVVFEREGSPTEILQTKHQIRSSNLTDTSSDLWKTLRIWIEGQSSGAISADTQFFLITTATCSEGTAAAYLRPENRNEINALERLSATASTSLSEANRPAYEAFRSMPSDQRKLFLKSVTVLDDSPSIAHLDDQLRQAVFYAVERRFLDSYLERMEGWWYRRVVAHLLEENPGPILGEELESEASRIREQFREDNLPVDDDIMRDTIDASGYVGRAFVEQLNLIGVNQNRVVHAIRNYYRAFVQRSRWMREDLLYVGELDRYEDRLIEEWDLMFQQMQDELGGSVTEDEKMHAASNLYKWVETGAHQAIRPAVTEPSIARGTYQMLADDLRVGWHLEFLERLQALLTQPEVCE